MTKTEHIGELKCGERDPIYTVDHFHPLALHLSIGNTGLIQRELAIITASDLQFRDDTLTVYDSMGRQLNLRLKYNDNKKDEGRTVTLFTPYLLLNKTGLEMNFAVKSLITTQRSMALSIPTALPDNVEPLMFAYSNFEPLQSRAQVSISGSEWSKPLSFEAVGSSFTAAVVKEDAGYTNIINIGVDIQEGSGPFYLTKVITFAPRYLLQNNLDEDLFIRQSGVVAQTHLPRGCTIPLLQLRSFRDFDTQLCIRLGNMHGEFSNSFTMNDIGSIFVKMGRRGSQFEDLIRVDVSLEKATLFLSFLREERWPIRIENKTTVNVAVRQTDAKRRYLVSAGETCSYAWDFPSLPHKTLLLTIQDAERTIDVSKLGKMVPMKFLMKNTKRIGIIAIDVAADGPTFVVNLQP